MNQCEVPVIVKMPVELAKKIDLYAAKMEQWRRGASPSRSAAIRELLRKALEEKEENEGGEGNGK